MKDEGGRMKRRCSPDSFILHPSSFILVLVDLARFERATSTFAESRSHSAELQLRELAEAAGVEPAHAARGDLANRCHTVRRRLQVVNWRKGQDLNLQATSAVVFGTTALPVRLPFQKELRIADFEFEIALC